MALIEVGTAQLSRRARAQGMSFINSDAMVRNLHKAEGAEYGRFEHFIDAATFHDRNTTRNIAIQKEQPVGRFRSRENFHPRTPITYKSN